MSKDEGRKCEVDECRERIRPEAPDHVFCGTHWLMVPSTRQWAMFDAYQLGQCFGKVKLTQAWFDAVYAAADFLEKPGKKKHGQRK